MSPVDIELYAALFHGFSDRNRLRILQALSAGELRVSDIAAATGLSQSSASMHLACLWECGLLSRERRGREVHYRLIDGVDELLAAAERILAQAGESVGACPRYGSRRRRAA